MGDWSVQKGGERVQGGAEGGSPRKTRAAMAAQVAAWGAGGVGDGSSSTMGAASVEELLQPTTLAHFRRHLWGSQLSLGRLQPEEQCQPSQDADGAAAAAARGPLAQLLQALQECFRYGQERQLLELFSNSHVSVFANSQVRHPALRHRLV